MILPLSFHIIQQMNSSSSTDNTGPPEMDPLLWANDPEVTDWSGAGLRGQSA